MRSVGAIPPISTTESFDVVVLGAGAAGMMCAIEAGKCGQRVAVLDHAERAGKKILISGGGRCNFTNLHCRPENFLSANPHFARSALSRYTPADFLALVDKHGIAYHEKTLGQLFCDRSAQQIVSMLEAECRAANARMFLNTRITDVRRDDLFHVRTPECVYTANALVVATGGLSVPKMGATGLAYEIARQFGAGVRACRPGLVPLTFRDEEQARYGELAGVSAEVETRCVRQKFREKMLLTHRGLSGPAVLQISSYWQPGMSVEIDLAPEKEWTAAWRDASVPRNDATAKHLLRGVLPQRLADRWLALHPPADWTNRSLAALEGQLHRWAVVPAGTEGYGKAEVTAGGIDTDELSAKTMESRKTRGLFFIGEAVDVTGQLGGFNFQWAWASGFCAGRAFAP